MRSMQWQLGILGTIFLSSVTEVIRKDRLGVHLDALECPRDMLALDFTSLLCPIAYNERTNPTEGTLFSVTSSSLPAEKKKIRHVLRKPEILNLVHKSPLLSNMFSLDVFPSCFCKISIENARIYGVQIYRIHTHTRLYVTLHSRPNTSSPCYLAE